MCKERIYTHKTCSGDLSKSHIIMNILSRLLSLWLLAISALLLIQHGTPLHLLRSKRNIVRKRSVVLTSESKDSSNIDLFAASFRKPPPTSVTITPSGAMTVKKDLVPVSPSLNKNNSALEMQAEYLRLEAELEQLKINLLRLGDERAFLVGLDQFISKILVEKAFENDVVFSRLMEDNKATTTRKELYFRLAELANACPDEADRAFYITIADRVLEYWKVHDPASHSALVAVIQRDITSEMDQISIAPSSSSSPMKIFDEFKQQWITIPDDDGSSNATVTSENSKIRNAVKEYPTVDSMGRTIVRFPAALPVSMLPFILRSPEISKLDFEVLRDTVFTPDVLNGTLADYSTFLGTFRGKPTVSVEATYATIMKRIRLVPGLEDRIRIFILPEPIFSKDRRPGPFTPPPSLEELKNPSGARKAQEERQMTERYSGTLFEPVFTILSKEAVVRKPEGPEYVLKVLAFFASIFTTFIFAVDTQSLNNDFVTRALAGDDAVVIQLLPILSGVILLQIMHDLGHIVAAKINGIEIALPVYVPSLQLGLFGSVTRFLSYPKDRKAYFDVAIAGPVFGFLSSVACIVTGIILTQQASPAEIAQFPGLPIGFFDSSVLLHEILNYIPRNVISLPASDAVATITSIQNQVTPVHPLIAVGITGMYSNALNFLPIGRLDGGRVAMAIAGRRSAAAISLSALIAQAVSFIANSSPVYLFWAIFVVLFQRSFDLPPENDVSPIVTDEDAKKLGFMYFVRLASMVLCVLLTAAMILPIPMDPSMMMQSAGGGGSTGLLQGLQSLPMNPSMPPPII